MLSRQGSQSNQGFTLIELLIVVAIIAILAAIAVPNFLEAQVRSKLSRAKSDMRALSVGFESYHVDSNLYPMNYKTADGPLYGTMPLVRRMQQVTSPIAYLTALPQDVFTHKISFSSDISWVKTPGNQTYIYCRGDQRIVDPSLKPVGRDCWMLNSSGPDNNVESMSYWTPEEMIASERTSPCGRYDPSNGTVSPGDIFRWGPGDKTIGF